MAQEYSRDNICRMWSYLLNDWGRLKVVPLSLSHTIQDGLLVVYKLTHILSGLYFDLSCRQRIIHCTFLQHPFRTGKRHFKLLLAIAQWWNRLTDFLPGLSSSYSCAGRAGRTQEHHSVFWISLLPWILYKAEKLPLHSWKEGWIRTFRWECLYHQEVFIWLYYRYQVHSFLLY